MNLILIEPAEVHQSIVTLRDRRSTHIVEVLRAAVGDIVRLGEVNGLIGTGRIMAMDTDCRPALVTLEIDLSKSPPPPVGIDLILALPRPIMLKKILAQAASLGVKRIMLINANRVEKSFFGATLLRDEEYQIYLRYGLEQARDTILPEVTIHQRFRPFIEDEVPLMRSRYCRLLLAHPPGELITSLNPMSGAGEGVAKPMLLAVGQEGGWVDFEIDRFREQGFVAISLGDRILRMDTAVVTLLSQLSLLDQLNTSLPD